MFRVVSFVCVLLMASLSSSTATTVPKPSTVWVVQELFQLLDISANAQACVTDVGDAGADLRDVGLDVKAKNYTLAASDMSSALSSLSSSVQDCNVPQLQTKLDALAAAFHFANATKGFDSAVKLFVGAADLWPPLEAMLSALESGSSSSIASALNNLMNEWTTVTGGCGSSKQCQLIDGILRIVQAVAADIQPCEAALTPALNNLTYAITAFESKQYQTAVSSLAFSLDAVAQALDSDSCGLKPLAGLIAAVAPKLGAAIVKIESSGAVHILVESADIYDDVYQLVEAVKSGSYSTVGMELGKLLQLLRAAGCKTPACVVLQGILGTLQIEASDFETCSSDIDQTWNQMQQAVTAWDDKQYGTAIEQVVYTLGTTAQVLQGCGVQNVATVIENAATALGKSGVAKEIGSIVAVMVSGADASHEFAVLLADIKAGRTGAIGNDLLQLSSFLTSVHCQTTLCKIVEGLMDVVGTGLADLAPCEASLEVARSAFDTGLQDFENKQWGDGLKQVAGGLSDLTKSVSACGLTQELGYLQQEANLLGFSNVTLFGEVASVLMHGVNYYDEIYNTYESLATHDYRDAGSQLATILQQMSQWTTGHACTSDVCYTVLGVLQFISDFDGSLKKCEMDFEDSWHNLTAAYDEFSSSHHNIIFHWSEDKAAIKAGVSDLGHAMGSLADAVTDCDLQLVEELLAKLAAKLGIAPEISWIEDVLKILIDGKDIFEDVNGACQAYSVNNWPAFGFDLAKLIKVLV